MKFILILCVLLSAFNSFARSYRGDYKTNVKCNISSYGEARDCMVRLARYMPSEASDNAVLVTRSKKSKLLMKELLEYMNSPEDSFYIERADYLAVAVQNDDEESVYYYALSNGINITPKLLGQSLSVVDDVASIFCHEDYSAFRKFLNPNNLFLGMNYDNALNGRIWFADDMGCW